MANGKDFIAVARIYDKSGALLAAAGEPCDKVPAKSLDWLVRLGRITAAPAKVSPAKGEA